MINAYLTYEIFEVRVIFESSIDNSDGGGCSGLVLLATKHVTVDVHFDYEANRLCGLHS